MNKLDYAQVEELVQHTDLLLDNAKANLEDIKRAIKDPSFLKSAMKQREMVLRRKMSEILQGQADLREVMAHK
jgi:polyhydroxyalkanoate synthesis regulator phasin